VSVSVFGKSFGKTRAILPKIKRNVQYFSPVAELLMFSSPQLSCWQEPASPKSPQKLWRGKALKSFAEVGAVLDGLIADMTTAGYPEKDRFGVRLAIDEAIANAIKHGNKQARDKWVWVRYRVTPESVLASVEDQGPGFNPEDVPDPLAPENLERGSGRGLFLMRSYMTWVRHNERGNCITLCKYRTVA
jgi:serine/threonine-protein kinase RsbW